VNLFAVEFVKILCHFRKKHSGFVQLGLKNKWREGGLLKASFGRFTTAWNMPIGAICS
jgi:hypothetical protein